MPPSLTVGLRHSEMPKFMASDNNDIVVVFPLPAGPFRTSNRYRRKSVEDPLSST